MSKKQKYIIFCIPMLLICSIGFKAVVSESKEAVAILQTEEEVFEAGSDIVLDFELSASVKTQLFLHTAFGSTIIESDTGHFIVPEFVCEKKGLINYELVYNSKTLYQSKIRVKTRKEKSIQLASYIGPPSITAGGKDFTMHVIIPTDSYDNPLPDSTAIQIKHQFLDIENEETLYSKDMIGWSTIYSYNQSGRMLLSSKVGDKASKEFSIEIFPSLSEDFQISSERKHPYADGNQITKFITSVLKDRYGNIISDGTLVAFIIKDINGSILQTQGSTINGKAIAKILHPDHKDIWEVRAFVPGIAKSNMLSLEYKSVLEDFDVIFTKSNRKISVGPLLSFMDQLIPDGAVVTLKISQDGEDLETKIKTSSDGVVQFNLEEGFYPSGNYDVEIKALGVQKEYKNKKLQ